MPSFTEQNWPPRTKITNTRMQQLADNDVYLKDLIESLPKGFLGSASKTSHEILENLWAPGRAEDIASLTTTVTVGSGRKIKISANWRGLKSTKALGVYSIEIKEGSSTLQGTYQYLGVDNVAHEGGSSFVILNNPSSGSHTYKITVNRLTGTTGVSGTNYVTWECSSATPSHILVEDIGPAT